jgi:hypothetical protein
LSSRRPRLGPLSTLAASFALVGLACAKLPLNALPPVPVTLTVRDPAGTGVAGAGVSFRAVQGYIQKSGETDSTGSVTLDLIPEKYSFVVYGPSGYPASAYGSATITHDNNTLTYTYAGKRVTGRVLDPVGTPLGRGWIEARQGSYRIAYADLQGGGAFSLLIAPGAYFFVAIGEPNSGLPATSTGWISITADTTLDVPMQGVALSGVVFGPGGLPLPRSTLVADAGTGSASSTVADDQGHYQMYAPLPGYRTTVRPDTSYILPRSFPYTTIAAPTVRDFDLSGAEWTGTVRLSTSGDPVPLARVSAQLYSDPYNTTISASCTADGNGSFRLVVEPGREYTVVANSSDYTDYVIVRFVPATADSTFDIYIDPLAP